MKNKTIYWIIGIIITVVILYNYSNLFTISKPLGPGDLDNYIHSYYSPTTTLKTNSEKCTNKNIEFGSNIAFTTTSLPTGSSLCIYSDKTNLFVTKGGSSKTGKCSDLGKDYQRWNMNIFTKIHLIKTSSGYLFCKDNSNGKGYSYSILKTNTKICPVKYTSTNIDLPDEKEGKYFCDSKTGRIYLEPCGSKSRQLIEECGYVGCEYANVNIDSGNVSVVKCKGDYEPNINICSSSDLFKYTTDSKGKLTQTICTSCKKNQCTNQTINYFTGCKLLSGNGNLNNIDILFYTYNEMPDYGDWLMSQLKYRTPFSEFNYNLYIENPKYACNGKITLNQNDVRIGFGETYGHIGWGEPSARKGKPGELAIRPDYSNKKWEFLLFHELGHIYTHAGHTCDGSIMQVNGGDKQYRTYQIELIRKNLNSTMAIYDPKYPQCMG